MNKAIIIGNLTKDPELRTTPQGVSVCTFRVAVPRPYKRDETDYLNIVTWRGLAENCAKFLSKGRKVGIVGYIQTREYDDSNGQRRYITEIVADDVEFLSPRGESTGSAPRMQDVPPPPDDEALFGDEPDDFEPLDDEQMPF
ncbi:MAG: single-stranded DNA-binding protein [Christensenellaceae bacterium]|nr:single-stranded DNA-binding protein [Christensenellaceae bacterium]